MKYKLIRRVQLLVNLVHYYPAETETKFWSGLSGAMGIVRLRSAGKAFKRPFRGVRSEAAPEIKVAFLLYSPLWRATVILKT